ncbi:dienelactone hydrolase [Mycobacterium antarcticum]|uniref:dienelactone hydrolase family protein n=1 Tax=Mycolicibacterium sp. TUM20983 TaxID=3023369 RepID=UPI00238E9184|nr:dienelactone hydrolase family protein [Mycolicibacterium sp. TUM20983]GLP77375.1 dienelactone hydrolase [Mycolicibacterium sp. TUM20983]
MSSLATLSFDYELDGLDCHGVMVSGDDAQAPTVLVFHGMEGRSDAQVEFCERLAATGYRAVAVDIFGREVSQAVGREGMAAGAPAMDELLLDRDMLRDRLLRVVETVGGLPTVERDAMAAIGFCFGGLCVLDLARHDAPLRAVGSFHGVLTPPPVTPDTPIATRIAFYHGWEDPFAPPADVLALAAELTARGADWQVHAYGHAMHAFMAPFANDPEHGIQYDEVTARRAWVSLVDMLAETFGR